MHRITGYCLLILIFGLSFTLRRASISMIVENFFKSDILSNSTVLENSVDQCTDISSQLDQCQFVMNTCHGFSAFYLRLYYCSTFWKPISLSILLGCLLMLFGAISVVASDFFCPNLQTISSKLQLSESMAGVTVLALGNGSPDLFSTFSALDTGAGSLAIGELIGAAFFIVAIVSGCMSIIQPFQSQRVTFMRDASFLTGAIIIMTWIVYHQQITWYHSVILICYYLAYVSAVVISAYSTIPPNHVPQIEPKRDDASFIIVDESSHLLSQGKRRPPRLMIPEQGFNHSTHSTMSHLSESHMKPMSPSSCHRSVYFDAILSRSTSMAGSVATSRSYLRPMTPRVGIRTSLFGAIEFQQQVNVLKRADQSKQTLTPDENRPRQRQTSLPYSMWQTSSSDLGHHMENNKQGLLPPKTSGRRSRPTSYHSALQPSNPMTDDYFTFLSAPQPHAIQNQPLASSSSPSQLLAPDIAIPQIRLAPPITENNCLALPTMMNRQTSASTTDYIQAHSRFNSNYSLAPPASVLSDCESFVSAEQHFELSPSPSFDHGLHKLPYSKTDERPPCHDEDVESDLHVNRLGIPNAHPKLMPPIHDDNDSFVSSFHPQQNNRYSSYPSSRHPGGSFRIALYRSLDRLFVTFDLWCQKTVFSKVSSLMAMPIVLIFTLTLPVVDPEEAKADDLECFPMSHSPVDHEEGLPKCGIDKHYLSVPGSAQPYSPLSKMTIEDMEINTSWNKYLLMTQCIFGTLFVFCNLSVINGIIPVYFVLFSPMIGILLAYSIYQLTQSSEPPSWHWMLSFAGFFVALNWIFLLANEVVGLLQALGKIFSISDAIMGLTVFALGNSIGDFVSNTSIAKMGFPTMAISACYAGPLLNMVLGVGVSSLYQNLKSGTAYKLEIAPTIIISSFGLITVLMSTLVVVNTNEYHMTKSLGWWMIGVYSVCCITNLILEFCILG
ncbi:Sodium/calcium exchanger protein-domain-containing protein [Blakeslea trispora]|nr:Sodium/calcium exchanger protein-domain-containing protein [Blakeslea trispora]